MVSKKEAKGAATSSIDLNKSLFDKKNELIDLKKSFMSGELNNPHALSKTRKEIAQILTKLNSKESLLDKENK